MHWVCRRGIMLYQIYRLMIAANIYHFDLCLDAVGECQNAFIPWSPNGHIVHTCTNLSMNILDQGQFYQSFVPFHWWLIMCIYILHGFITECDTSHNFSHKMRCVGWHYLVCQGICIYVYYVYCIYFVCYRLCLIYLIDVSCWNYLYSAVCWES